MPRRKRTKGEGALAKEIRERLRELYLKDTGKGWSQRTLAKEIPVSFQTVNGWFREPPAMPGITALVAMARRHNLNLNHLLLGEGLPLRGQAVTAGSLEEGLRAHIVAELRGEAEIAEVEDVLRIIGPPLGSITGQARDELERVRRIRRQIATDAEEARLALVGRNEETKKRWVQAGHAASAPARTGSLHRRDRPSPSSGSA